MILECRELHFAIAEVTVVIAVGEPGCEFSQVALSDRLTAQGTEGSRLGRPAIHQDEFHCPSPNEKQSKRCLACMNARACRNFSAGKPAEASRSTALAQTQELSSMIERLFGIPDLQHLNQG